VPRSSRALLRRPKYRAPCGLRLNLTRDSGPLSVRPVKAAFPLVNAPDNLLCATCRGNSGIANRIPITGLFVFSLALYH
jgi:hypothetical protein